MRKLINLPKNEEFFGQYGHLLPRIKLSKNFSQVISAMTEIGVIWNGIYLNVVQFLPTWAFIFATVGSILGTVVLEGGINVFIPQSVKNVIYFRVKGIQFAMSIFVWLTSIILIGACAKLSFDGSKFIVESVISGPEVKSVVPLYDRMNTKNSEIKSNYNNDKSVIESTHNAEITAVNASYLSKIEKKKEHIQKYERKEKSSGKSYRSTKDRDKAEIASLRAKSAAEIAVIEKAKGKKLATLLDKKNSDIDKNELSENRSIAKTENKNESLIKKSKDKIDSYGLGLGVFTLICLGVFILMTIVEEIIKKGSGIEEVAIQEEGDFKDNFLVGWWKAVTYRFSNFQRILIQRFENNTSPPPEPGKPPILYDKSATRNEIIKMYKQNKAAAQNLKAEEEYFTAEYPVGSPLPYSPTKPKKSRGNKPSKPTKPNPTKATITYAGINNEIPPREYTYSKVTSLISKHKDRVYELNQKARNKDLTKRDQTALDNNKMRRDYWLRRIKEFHE